MTTSTITPNRTVKTVPGKSTNAVSVGLWVMKLGPGMILVLLAIAMTIANPLFFTERNMQNLAMQTASIAILALGQLLVILTGGIDLSVGSVLSLASVVGATIFIGGVGNGLVVIGAMVLVGAIAGWVNGAVFVLGRIPSPFIVTLAMLSVASGLALSISNGQPLVGMPDSVNYLGSAFVGPVPVSLIFVAVLGVAVWVLTRKMTWGRWIYAIGSNEEAARRVGIPVKKVMISVYVFAGIAAGLAAIVVSGRTNSGYPTAGSLAELDAIAAVIIGGASFTGGRGGVSNALIGALTLGVIRNGLNLLGVNQYIQIVIIGATIVLAVLLDVYRTRAEARFRAILAQRSVTSQSVSTRNIATQTGASS
ncbi:ribose ABC transporter permease [Frondihabitans sucicola]|uniref:Ribose ABC transporter permease n=1 Tax=Frondihabitans sucicola TaxID=1268041 RepID=A0ABM8GLN9_9MICO|nr:ABC transporter permease [Frondihabitans sucicola]BDZ49330.1 ribose ABC transporter permease [Frondihabitans sucicola]